MRMVALYLAGIDAYIIVMPLWIGVKDYITTIL
jgi:hypothetical protein